MLINERDRREIVTEARNYCTRNYDHDLIAQVDAQPIGIMVTLYTHAQAVVREFRFYTISEAIRFFKEH